MLPEGEADGEEVGDCSSLASDLVLATDVSAVEDWGRGDYAVDADLFEVPKTGIAKGGSG